MAKTVSTIKLNFTAGTAELFTAIDSSNAKILQFKNNANSAGRAVKDFGEASAKAAHTSQSNFIASAAAIRAIEGNFNNNIRAVERFLSVTLKLGPVFDTIFPLVGGIAFAGLLVKLAEHAIKFGKEMASAAEKSTGAFRVLNAATERQNDEIEATNVKLQNQLDKLQGRRQNVLKEMLFEARVEADKLAESLGKSIKELGEILSKNEISGFQRTLDVLDSINTGAPIQITGVLKRLKEQIVGISGVGGFEAQIAKINQAGNEALSAAAHMPTGTDADKEAANKAKINAQQTLQNNLTAEYKRQIDAVDTALKPILDLQKKQWEQEKAYNAELAKIPGLHNAATDAYRKISDPKLQQLRPETSVDWNRYAERLNALRLNLARQLTGVGDQFTESALKAAVKGAEEVDREAKAEAPLTNKINELKAQVAESVDRLKSAGLDDIAQAIAKSEGEAIKAIEEVNKRLTAQNHNVKTLMSPASEAEIKLLERVRYTNDAFIERDNKLRDIRDKIADEVLQQNLLNQALGKGYDALNKATVEIELMKSEGSKLYQLFAKAPPIIPTGLGPGQFIVNPQEVDRVKQAGVAQGKHTEEIGKTIIELGNQIGLETKLAQVQSLGSAAVKLATLQYNLSLIQRDKVTKDLTADERKMIELETERFRAENTNQLAEATAKIDEQVAAVKRLNAAYLDGADAVRKATLENKLAELSRQGALTIPSGLGFSVLSPQAQATIKESEAERDKGVIETKINAERLRGIDEQISKLREAQSALGDSLGIEMHLKELEQERLKIMAEEALSLGRARDGFRAFFIEMQEQARTTAMIIYDALNSVLEKSSENLAKMLTQKPPKGGWGQQWGKEFQSVGETIVQSSIKSTMQKGLGALGLKLGAPDGSKSNPFWVVNAAASGGGNPNNINIPFFGGGTSSPSNFGGFGSGTVGGSNQIPKVAGSWISKLFSTLLSPSATSSSSAGIPTVTPELLQTMGIAGALAGGGDMSAGGSYLVGENGPEILSGVSGRVTSNADSRRILGSGGTTIYQVNAPNSDLGAGHRIQRALELTHRTAVANAVQANVEKSKRVPSK